MFNIDTFFFCGHKKQPFECFGRVDETFIPTMSFTMTTGMWMDNANGDLFIVSLK